MTRWKDIGTGKELMARRIARKLAGIALCTGFVWGGVGRAQEPAPAAVPLQEESQKNLATPCVQPPPLLRWEDYDGKFGKIVGIFGRRLERKSVHPPHYKPGAVLCTLELKDKFMLFVQDSYDPLTFLSAGFDAGIGQAENSDPSFGQGAEGYGKRFGANYAGLAASEFFKDFAYPSIFSEDPRYYRLAHGSGGRRLLHAMGHVFVAHKEDGSRMFNFSEWLGTTSAVALSNTYDPDNKRGFAPAAQRVGLSFAADMGFDVLREFWPEIARKFKLPFRDQSEPKKPEPVPATK
jgi:hypothetical protein